MAVVYPTAAGDWSTRTWNDDATGAAYSGGTPQIGDTVLTNGVTITMDQNITIAEISNRAGTNATAGGTLGCPNGADGLTLNSNVIGNASGGAVTVSMSVGNSLTVNGDITGATGAGAQNSGNGIRVTSTGNLVLNGNVVGGSVTLTAGVSFTSSGTGTINGNCQGGSGSAAYGLVVSNASAVVTVNGDAIRNSGTQGVHGVNGIIIIKRSRTVAGQSGLGYVGRIRFIDENEPDIVEVRAADGTYHFLTKTGINAAKPSLRGGFAN
jgi:hypothetical protein